MESCWVSFSWGWHVTDLSVVAQNWQLIVSSVIALMFAKAIMIYMVARVTKSSHTEALDRALLMAQGGEFAFVLFLPH